MNLFFYFFLNRIEKVYSEELHDHQKEESRGHSLAKSFSKLFFMYFFLRFFWRGWGCFEIALAAIQLIN